MDESRLVTCL